MNILLLNQDWFASELKAAGHNVVTCGAANHLEVRLPMPMLHISTVLQSLPPGFAPDAIIWLDNSAPVVMLGLEECELPLVFYSVDTHHHADLHSYLSSCFDHVFVAQKDYVDHFPKDHASISWLPLWAPRYIAASKEKRFETAFVGTLDRKLNPKRVDFFADLQNRIPVHIEHGEYWNVFPHAEIVINQTVKGDLNFRVFEAMMSGALLLTERTGNGLLDLFEEGAHLVTYEAGNATDAARRATELLGNPAKMRAIARAGRDETLEKHTATHRAREVMDVLERLEKRPPTPLRYYAMMVNHSVIAALAEGTHKPMAAKALVAALKASEQALITGISPGQFETAHLVLAGVRYDRMTGSDAGKRLLLAYAERYADNPLLAFARIRAVLNDGKRSEAEVFARQLSTRPVQETFTAAEDAIALLLDLAFPELNIALSAT